MSLRQLKKKEKRKFFDILKKQFGFEDKLDYVFLINNKNKVFIINKDIAQLDLNKIKINSLGLYIAELREEGVRLSIEGSQIIGPKSKRNIININKENLKKWLSGEDIPKDKSIKNLTGFVIVKSGNDYLGCGKIKEDKILNFFPKIRRITT